MSLSHCGRSSRVGFPLFFKGGGEGEGVNVVTTTQLVQQKFPCAQGVREKFEPRTDRSVRPSERPWVYACMVTHIARVWINRVRLPILLVVS